MRIVCLASGSVRTKPVGASKWPASHGARRLSSRSSRRALGPVRCCAAPTLLARTQPGGAHPRRFRKTLLPAREALVTFYPRARARPRAAHHPEQALRRERSRAIDSACGTCQAVHDIGHVCATSCPRATQRAVLERDGLRCTWRGADGVRCTARAWFERDHRQPRALGGGSELENVRHLCRARPPTASRQGRPEHEGRSAKPPIAKSPDGDDTGKHPTSRPSHT